MTKTMGTRVKFFVVAIALALAGVTAGMAADDADAMPCADCFKKERPAYPVV